MMRPSVQGVGPPSVLRLLLHMQGIVPVDFRRAFCPLEGGGGGGQTYWHQAYKFSPRRIKKQIKNT